MADGKHKSSSYKTGAEADSLTERWIITGAASAAAAYTWLSSNGRQWQVDTENAPGSGRAMTLQEVSLTSSEDGPDIWEADLTFSTKQSTADSYSRSADIGGEYIDVWRTGVNLSLQGGSPSSATDINGTKVDSAGEPVSQFRVRSNLQITRVVNVAPFSAIWNAIGTRNNGVFEGAGTGTLLFTGAKVATIEGCSYEVTYNFVSDEWYHMVQRPRREADGKVELNSDKQAAFVAFFQPFPNTSNFSTLVGGSDPC
jgi:hypothetical protein